MQEHGKIIFHFDPNFLEENSIIKKKKVLELSIKMNLHINHLNKHIYRYPFHNDSLTVRNDRLVQHHFEQLLASVHEFPVFEVHCGKMLNPLNKFQI